ncbi:MAG: penicillin-binding protein 2 [Alphaproteobacteria bacterium]|jgi:penicillin-binding protein 2
MIRDQDRYKLFTRRAILLGGGKLALFSTLAARMYYLQVVESERYHTLAEDNRINLRLLAPPRGRILDRHGVEIAANQQNYRLIIVTERIPDIAATLDRIGLIVSLGDHDRRRVLGETRRRRGFVPVTVRENLDWEEVARIEVNAHNLPGVHIEVGETRFYPYNESAAHLIGYVGAVSAREQTGDPLLELPSFRIGKNGIERAHEERLRGRAGRSEVEVNALGRVIRELARREGQPGDEVRLSVDIELQNLAHKRLEGQSGAVVVMDVHSGETLVLASTPGFDPNAFNKGISRDYWQELMANERAPLTNKAITGQYSPGSTFKPIVALAALEAGIITPEHSTFCNGHVQLGNVRFHCWKKRGHGRLDLEGALQQSCDIFFYDIAKRVGVDRISAMARKFGLGNKLGIELPGEKAGVMPTKKWKRALIGKPWQLGETLVTGIGQGFVLTTPLQLAVMTARIANGGLAVTPKLSLMTPDETRQVPSDDAGGDNGTPESPPLAPIGVSEAALDAIRRGMYAVSNTPRGTAYRTRIREKGMEIAGKTGTSQVRRITLAERDRGVSKNKDLPWRERDHALFIAYAPADAPKYAIAVIVEHGGGGSSTAAPIAHDVMQATLKRDPLSQVARVAAPPQDERN